MQKNPTALSNFKKETLTKRKKCVGCHTQREPGDEVLISRYTNRFGHCTSIVCNEECWRDFDDQYWQGIADERDSVNTVLYGGASEFAF